MEKPQEGLLCWIEIPTRNPLKLKEFYSCVFPKWTWREDADEDVIHFVTGNEMSGGLMKMKCEQQPVQPLASGITVYFYVDSIEDAIARTEKHGGKLLIPKKEAQDHGWYAHMSDIEGNRFGVYLLKYNCHE